MYNTFALFVPLLTALTTAHPNPNPQATYPPSQDLCGIDSHLPLPSLGYDVINALYGSSAMTAGDTECTHFSGVNGRSVSWSATTHVANVPATSNICKGYSAIAITQDFGKRLTEIANIPATYSWSRKILSPFRGNTVFDFIVAPTPRDGSSTATQELMLWLNWEGGQLPIGWDNGGTTVMLYGRSWKLYEGVNPGNGVTVHSLLPDKQYVRGQFKGDLKKWIMKIADMGRFPKDSYLNVGNAGTEIFYGDAVMQATLSVQINAKK